MIIENGYLALTVFSFITSVSSVVNCGDKTCKNNEYCVEDGFCNSCEDICQPSSHNYDEATCKNKCSDYNLDSLYRRITDDINDAVKELYIYVAVSLVVSISVLILVLSSLMTLWLKYRKIQHYKNNNEEKFKKKIESIVVVSSNNEVGSSKKLKLDLTVPTADKDTPPSALTTMTPLSRRHPSEDTTLEYAYDNPTLTYSPDLAKHESVNTVDMTPKTSRTETSF